ncbi:PQQ-binding-like beta-propeller repeat protein [Streptomyces sp. NPDC046887]|uniref:outer membrane protein assembly factor BamB family protein n=1 Tax=Streptomyces sp. NPDC046887 TaxID=3155472 RepID=UPI00340AEC30
MTQPPPPPPNQPPGQPPHQPPGHHPGPPPSQPPGTPPAPAAPPAGGYGYPQAPQAQPQTPPPSGPPQGGGYGYPQTPPAAAYPQQPEYGQPPAPGQPPAYGYPQPAGYGYPQAPGQPVPATQPVPAAGQSPSTGRKKLSAQAKIIIAAAVAIVLIIGAGVVYSQTRGSDGTDEARGGSSAGTDGGKDGKDGGKSAPDGDGKEKVPGNTASKVAFQVPTPVVPDLTTVSGAWVTDTAFVKVGVGSVAAYDPDKGTQLWKLDLPGDVCAASRHAQDGKTAIAFAAKKGTAPNYYEPCTEVGAVDLKGGKLLWTKSVTGGDAGDGKVRYDEITVGGGTVAAGGTDGGAAWDLATGKELWKPEVNAESCKDRGYAGGEGLAAARVCGPSDQQYVLIQSLNPKTGAPISEFKMPDGVDTAGIISTKPLVAAADVGDTAGDGSSISDFFSIDEKTGKLKAKITANADKYAAECGSTEVEQCEKAVVGNNRLYIPTEPYESEDGITQTNDIVSFDLDTGKPTSDRAVAGPKHSMVPLRMDGGNLIAYKPATYHGGGVVVSLHGGTMKETVLMRNPAEDSVSEAESAFSDEWLEMRYADGRFFLSTDFVNEPRNPETDRKYMAMVLTTH